MIACAIFSLSLDFFSGHQDNAEVLRRTVLFVTVWRKRIIGMVTVLRAAAYATGKQKRLRGEFHKPKDGIHEKLMDIESPRRSRFAFARVAVNS
jgi:hypothetical protein